jgi:hypothetical protein
MDEQAAYSAIKAIIDREAADGCCMASDSLIEPALRRWRSYDRRTTRSKDHSIEHRANDLRKGWLETVFDGNHSYDMLCLEHLARSFAEVLSGEPESRPSHT